MLTSMKPRNDAEYDAEYDAKHDVLSIFNVSFNFRFKGLQAPYATVTVLFSLFIAWIYSRTS